MPTEYTAAACEREQTFQEYALGCARAFGALIDMRDDPQDAVIPDSFPYDDYHERELLKAKAELGHLEGLFAEARAEFGAERRRKAIRYAEETLRKTQETRYRLVRLLKAAEVYQAPSADHEEYKSFMIQQLQSTLKWDGNVEQAAQALTAARERGAGSYYDAVVDSARWNVEYHETNIVEERNAIKTETTGSGC